MNERSAKEMFSSLIRAAGCLWWGGEEVGSVQNPAKKLSGKILSRMSPDFFLLLSGTGGEGEG